MDKILQDNSSIEIIQCLDPRTEAEKTKRVIFKNVFKMVYVSHRTESDTYRLYTPLGHSHLLQTYGMLKFYQSPNGKSFSDQQINIVTRFSNLVQAFRAELGSLSIHHVDSLVLLNFIDLSLIFGNNIPLERFRTANLSGYYLTLNNQRLLVLSPTAPFAFGDRAGLLVEAVKPLGLKSVIACSATGAFPEQGIQVGQIVVPTRYHMYGNPEIKRTNFARSLDFDVPVHYTNHITVNSPEEETLRWFQHHAYHGIESVDCESHFILRALNRTFIQFFQALIVSDILLTDTDISAYSDGKMKQRQQDQISTVKTILRYLNVL